MNDDMNLVDMTHADYQSYLLRVWRDESRGIWHASLQSTVTKHIHHFADVESLLYFLALQRPLDNSADGERLNE